VQSAQVPLELFFALILMAQGIVCLDSVTLTIQKILQTKESLFPFVRQHMPRPIGQKLEPSPPIKVDCRLDPPLSSDPLL
jgi:hypothetical protein